MNSTTAPKLSKLLGFNGTETLELLMGQAAYEIERLREQVGSLQASNTTEVERRRLAEADARKWRALVAGIKGVIEEASRGPVVPS